MRCPPVLVDKQDEASWSIPRFLPVENFLREQVVFFLAISPPARRRRFTQKRSNSLRLCMAVLGISVSLVREEKEGKR